MRAYLESLGKFEEILETTAEENKKTAVSSGRTTFLLQSAENYVVPEAADRFYFFNPFSVEILRSVLERILVFGVE